MKTILFLLAGALFSLSSCKKLVEDQKRDALIKAIITGQWRVESYTEGTTAVTAQFEGYQFQFNENGSVAGITGSQTTMGTWAGDIQNYSIMSDFPGAVDPIRKLNGTWKITDSEWNSVVAEMNTPNQKMILRLRKI